MLFPGRRLSRREGSVLFLPPHAFCSPSLAVKGQASSQFAVTAEAHAGRLRRGYAAFPPQYAERCAVLPQYAPSSMRPQQRLPR